MQAHDDNKITHLQNSCPQQEMVLIVNTSLYKCKVCAHQPQQITTIQLKN